MNYIIIEKEDLILFFIKDVEIFFEKLIKKIESNDFRELDDDFKWGALPF